MALRTAPRGVLGRLRDRCRGERDEGVALLTVILLMLIVASLSLLIVGAVAGQVRPTSYSQKSTRTVAAAESGVQAALGSLRQATAVSAVDQQTYGDPAKLSCSLTGSVSGGGPDLTYAVSVTYYATDPSHHPDSWRSTNKLTCTSGHGVSSAGPVPRYALITSRGLQNGVVGVADSSGNRALQSTYAFQTSSVNIPRGIFWTLSQAFCLQPASASAHVGTALQYAAPDTCNARGDDVLWIHDTDNKIKLASTKSTGHELCVTPPDNGTGTGTATLQRCDDPSQSNQVWSYTGYTYTSNGSNCLWDSRGSTPVPGDPATVSNCGAGAFQTWWTWAPEPSVGAGDSGYTTGQFVNYANFGSCFEITWNSDNAAVDGIGPCKHGGAGNQAFSFVRPTKETPATTGQLRVRPNGTQLCLTEVTYSRTESSWASYPFGPEFPLAMDCNSVDPTRSQFTVVGDAGAYSNSYLIKDYLGRCLGAGPIYHPVSGLNFHTVIAATCNGGPEQKWNAPANVTPGSVDDTHETTP